MAFLAPLAEGLAGAGEAGAIAEGGAAAEGGSSNMLSKLGNGVGNGGGSGSGGSKKEFSVGQQDAAMQSAIKF